MFCHYIFLVLVGQLELKAGQLDVVEVQSINVEVQQEVIQVEQLHQDPQYKVVDFVLVQLVDELRVAPVEEPQEPY